MAATAQPRDSGGKEPQQPDAGWRTFWDHHADPGESFREEAEIYVRNLRRVASLDKTKDVLDFGCGFGFVAALVAPEVRTMFFWDSSPRMVEHARQPLALHANARYLELGPAVVADSLRMDLILVNSVLQYVATLEEAGAVLARLSGLLRPGGTIIASDIIPSQYSLARELLTTALRRPMFFLSRLSGTLTRYLSARRSLSLLRISRQDLEEIAAGNSLEVSFLETNLSHFPRRTTAIFRRPESAA